MRLSRPKKVVLFLLFAQEAIDMAISHLSYPSRCYTFTLRLHPTPADCRTIEANSSSVTDLSTHFAIRSAIRTANTCLHWEWMRDQGGRVLKL